MVIPVIEVLTGWLVFTRVAAMVIVLPVFAGTNVPNTVRLALALLTAFLVSPLVDRVPLETVHYGTLIFATAHEFIIGLVMGFSVQIVFAAFQFAAHTIGVAIGLMQQESLVGMAGMDNGIMQAVLYYLGTLIFLLAGFHYEVISAVVFSFEVAPLGSVAVDGFNFDAMVRATNELFVLGILMSAPFLAINFIISMTFAVFGKVAPKMNVFLISFPVRIFAGLLTLIGSVGLLAHYMRRAFIDIPEQILRFLLG